MRHLLLFRNNWHQKEYHKYIYDHLLQNEWLCETGSCSITVPYVFINPCTKSTRDHDEKLRCTLYTIKFIHKNEKTSNACAVYPNN